MTGPFTVVIDGREEEGGFWVYGLTDTSVIVAKDPDGRLEAIPLDQCRVALRYMEPGARLWWESLRPADESPHT